MNKGFTLIEMSIVLVIISLIIVGILGGEDILENSKRLSIISKIEKYKAAYDSFKEKYYSPPGDMADAESVWGASKTDNGDGDGVIETGGEDYIAWQHLGLAGFVNGYFSGSATGTSSSVVLGTDIPEGAYTKTGYRLLNATSGIVVATNAVQFGKYRTGSEIDLGAVDPKQALSIDQKIDDRNPSEGQLITISGKTAAGAAIAATNCVTAGGAGDEDDTYAVGTKTKDCIIYYYLDQTQQ